LAALPTPDRRSKQLNKQDSIGFLAKDLIASMRNGHTLDQLAGSGGCESAIARSA
jgi:hypothetical protein